MGTQWLLKCPCCGKTSSEKWWKNNELLLNQSWIFQQHIGGKAGIYTIDKFTPNDIVKLEDDTLLGLVEFIKARLLHSVCLLTHAGLIDMTDLRKMGVVITYQQVEKVIDNCGDEEVFDFHVKCKATDDIEEVGLDEILTGKSAARDGGIVDASYVYT